MLGSEKMYNIWLYDKNKGKGTPAKTDLNISEAFDYVSFAQENLKPNQQLITQEIKTGNVDMIFEKNSTTTPKYPMRFNKNGVLITPNQMNDKNWSNSMIPNQISKNKIGYDFITSRRKSKPTKSRGKWIGNMFKSSNKRLQNITKTGTPKQKSLARKILNNRRK
jgi:hypothetical protein